jgi:hypothetical protein
MKIGNIVGVRGKVRWNDEKFFAIADYLKICEV